MNPVVNTVAQTTRDLSLFPISGALGVAFSVIHKTHRTWRWYRWGKVYTNPDNFFKLTTGHVVNYAIGDNIVVRMAAQCVLIATRITDCVDQQTALSSSYNKWLRTIKGSHFTDHAVYRWSEESIYSFVSPSSSYAFTSGFDQTVKRIKLVAKHSYKLITQMFKLSMTLMDAVEAFSLSPSTRNEAVNELFVNGTKCLDKLVDNKDELLQKLRQNKPIIEKVLDGIGASCKTDQFIENVSKGLNKVQTVNQAVQKVNQAGNGILKDIVKQGIFGFMSTLGLAEFMPDFLLPPLDPPPLSPSNARRRVYGRYAPLHWVTRLNELERIPEARQRQKAEQQPEWDRVLAENRLIRYVKKSTPGGERPRLAEAPSRPRRFKPQSVQEALAEAIRLYGYFPNS